MRAVLRVLVILSLAWALPAAAPPGLPEVLGDARTHVVRPDESLIEIAREYGLGFWELAAANPGVDAFIPDEGTEVAIPTSFIVPRAAEPGAIVVNLSELRLYYWPPGRSRREVVSFPVGIAADEYATPLGTWHVVAKETDPAWYVPASARRDDPTLPAVVPPGPENPMGTHALKLSAPSILIHGTHRPYGVGRKVSRGCIRLYPEDIPRLYRMVAVGTPVKIVREPVKVGARGRRVFVEVHDELVAREDDRGPDGAREDAGGALGGAPGAATPADRAAEARELLRQRALLVSVDEAKVMVAAAEKRGIPVDVTR